MPKDNRLILSGIRVGDTVYVEGQEDELSAALSQEQLDRLMDKGALGGDWKAGKAAKVAEAPKGEMAAETARAETETKTSETAAPKAETAKAETPKAAETAKADTAAAEQPKGK